MISLAHFLQRKIIWPLVIFLGLITLTCIILCASLFYTQEIESRNFILEKAGESLKNPMSLGSYVEIKSRLISYNKENPQYCLDFYSKDFQTDFCLESLLEKKFNSDNKITIKITNTESLSLYYNWIPFLVKVITVVFIIVVTFFLIGFILLKKANSMADILNHDVVMIFQNVEKSSFKISEFKTISEKFAYYLSVQNRMRENEARAEMAKQVAHDIRSPLSALETMTESLVKFPETERVLVRHAIQRINDIANELLHKSSQKNPINAYEENRSLLTVELISILVDMTISEKRVEFRDRSNIIIETDLRNDFGNFSLVNSSELKRVISNIVNNSVEAFKNNHGKILIQVHNDSDYTIISIVDDGVGIPQHVLSELGKSKVTFGKEEFDGSGSGLGLYNAKKIIESFDGKLEINSIENVGTEVSLYLKRAEVPMWFAEQIDLTGKSTVVSLDDDISVHQIWKKRLNGVVNEVQILSGLVFEEFVHSNVLDIETMLFLVDYELLNQKLTGLELIKKLEISKNSILVTSRYDDIEIQNFAMSLGLRILPKSLAAHVPIINKISHIDVVLLDNDELVRLTWEIRAKKSGINIQCFSNAFDLKKNLKSVSRETIFYIDVHLSESEDGLMISKELFDLGFLNIYLATGYQPDHFQNVTWVKGIVGKKPPKGWMS